jgi:hypothetical protein
MLVQSPGASGFDDSSSPLSCLCDMDSVLAES